MTITVDELTKLPFLERSKDEMIAIIAQGKPRPQFNMAVAMMVNNGGTNEMQTRHFGPAIYDEVPWLTGCAKRESFFCWPCLLFKPLDQEEWSTGGISDFAMVIEGKSKHEDAYGHISATLQLNSMLETVSAAPNVKEDFLDDNAKRHRAILKRLTDVMCNLFIKEQSFYKRTNGCQISLDSYVKNLEFLRNYDTLNFNFIEDAIKWIKTSPDVINDLVDTVSDVIKINIKKEILQSTYVSLILSDHSEVSSQPQISTVLRYIMDGKICERFIGFNNSDVLKHLFTINQHISNVVNQFGLSEKLISVSIDGGVLPTNELPILLSSLRNQYPHLSFVPWKCHMLEYVLQQSLSYVSECNLFFKTINNLKIYLQKKSRRYKALEVFMDANNPSLRNTKWFVRSQMISVLNNNRKYFILFFESIIQNSHKWSADEIAKAVGFQKILEDIKSVFLLHIFTKLFQLTSPLNKLLNGRSSENVLSGETASQVIQSLAEERDQGFDVLWSKVEMEMCIEAKELSSKRIKLEVDDPESHKFRELYQLIFNHVIQDIELRFNTLEKLKFCQLLKFNQTVDFTSDMLQHMRSLLSTNFDEELAKNEIIVLRTNSTEFKDKSTYDMLKLFTETNLKSTFKCVHLLTQYFLTLPIKQTSADADSSKLQDIIDWSYVPVKTDTSGDVAIPCVELDFLQDLKKQETFHDDMFTNFCKETENSDFRGSAFERSNENELHYFLIKNEDSDPNETDSTLPCSPVPVYNKDDHSYLTSAGPISDNGSPYNHSYIILIANSDCFYNPVLRETAKYSDDDEEATRSKYEKTAKDLNLPFSIDDLTNLSTEEYYDRLSKCKITGQQLHLIKSIRRRCKNKLAAMNCRKRKKVEIGSLQQDLDVLREEKMQLISRQDHLLQEKCRIGEKYAQLSRIISQYDTKCRSESSNSVSVHGNDQ